MRKFQLVNANGQTYDLMDTTHFFGDVKGLGFTRSFEFIKSGADFVRVDEKSDQNTISGNMYFLEYADYSAFLRFIALAPLTLKYLPDGNIWYECTCNVKRLEKTEKDYKMHMLKCPIDFIAYDIWHTHQNAKESTPIVEGDDLKAYVEREDPITGEIEYAYSYIEQDDNSYAYMYSDGENAELYVNNGDFESPVVLHIFGPCYNPRWSISQYGKVLIEGMVEITLDSTEKLVVNAIPAQQAIEVRKIVDNEFVRNAYQNSDFSTGRFLYAPPGDSTIKIMTGGEHSAQSFAEVERIVQPI